MTVKVEIENIEQMDLMEENCGISLSGLYAEYEEIDKDSRYINVLGELYSKNGFELSIRALLKSVSPCPPSLHALKTRSSSSNLKKPSSKIVSSQVVY